MTEIKKKENRAEQNPTAEEEANGLPPEKTDEQEGKGGGGEPQETGEASGTPENETETGAAPSASGTSAADGVDEKTDGASGGEKSKKDKKTDKSDAKKWKAEAESLKKALDAEKKRADETNDRYLRLAAEYDNFRKRSQKEKEAVYGDAVADTVKGILPILDNLQYAKKYQTGDSAKFAEGVDLILSKVPETLEKLNVKAFGAVGDSFDPALHNAVMHVEDDTRGEGEIVEVLQCGYTHGDKVIRYAIVKVAN